VRIAWNETGLRVAVKKAGAIWHPREKIWEISREAVRTLGIGDRVVRGAPVSRTEPHSGI
jgi:hypothetical protein